MNTPHFLMLSNPTDRGKKGTKCHVAVNGDGILIIQALLQTACILLVAGRLVQEF